MQVVVSCDGEFSEEELRSLYGWLLSEAAARRYGHPELGVLRPPPEGHQGQVIDVLSLVLSSSFSAGSLAVAVAAWRQTRPRQPVLTVRRPDGTEVTIANASPDEAERLIRRLCDGGDDRGGA